MEPDGWPLQFPSPGVGPAEDGGARGVGTAVRNAHHSGTKVRVHDRLANLEDYETCRLDGT